MARQTTSVAHLGADRFAAMLFPRPPAEEQGRIAAVLQQQNRQIRCEEERLSKLNEIKTGLMQDLLTGKVRVKVDEIKSTV